MISYLVEKHIGSFIKSQNAILSKANIKLMINMGHVCQRLKERHIDEIDFIKNTKQIITSHLCQMVYATHLSKPFYTIEVKTDKMITIIGVSKSTTTTFTIRTVLDSHRHNRNYTKPCNYHIDLTTQ